MHGNPEIGFSCCAEGVMTSDREVLNELETRCVPGKFRTRFLRNQMLKNSPRTGVPGICENEVRARPERLDSREWQM